MTKKKFSAQAPTDPASTEAVADHFFQPTGNDTAGELDQGAVRSPSEPVVKERRRRNRAATPPPAIEPIELAAEFVSDTPRMQYALLLALLLRMNGAAKFTREDMSHNDADYNIVFSRTLDGQHLEVTVVSSQSGIIRSPGARSEQQPPQFAQLPLPGALPEATLEENLRRALWENEKSEARPQEPTGYAETSTVAESLKPTLTEQTPKPQIFPFDVGQTPDTARRMDLDSLRSRLLYRENQILQEQTEAAARLEEQQS